MRKGSKWSPEQRAKFSARVGSLEDRFWRKVNKATLTGCWEWIGSKTTDQYGQLWVGNTMKYAHRLSYEMHHGSIPAGLVICHACDNPKCVRPDHLFAGTSKDNAEDASRKGRLATHGTKRIPDEIAAMIRQRYDAGESRKQIAADYGVAIRTVRAIGSRQIRQDA